MYAGTVFLIVTCVDVMAVMSPSRSSSGLVPFVLLKVMDWPFSNEDVLAIVTTANVASAPETEKFVMGTYGVPEPMMANLSALTANSDLAVPFGTSSAMPRPNPAATILPSGSVRSCFTVHNCEIVVSWLTVSL